MYYVVTRKDDERDGASEATDAATPEDRPRRTRRNAKKERVLHTRVPEVLDQELKRLAGNLRVPVSNVVRAILEDALDAVDTVSQRTESELLGFVERLARQRDARRRESEPPSSPETEAETEADGCSAEGSELLDGVFGYQPMVLAAKTECTVCGRVFRAGQEAHRALFDDPGRRVFLGPDCRLLPAKES